uniref:USP domain-containing protein n=1 Tax=viral metagenome TaxID=1070528 RepID=A0A6C0E9E5_9ZZZZ
MNRKPYVIEDGLNTSYISSLLLGLFYNNSNNTEILNTNSTNYSGIYLQEIIKNGFVDLINKNYSVTSDILNEIRNYSYLCGWCKDNKYFFKPQDVIKYLDFLLQLFQYKILEIEKITVTEDMKCNEIIKKQYNIIDLEINENATIKNLLDHWFEQNIIGKKEIKNQGDYTLYIDKYYYKLTSIPAFIPISIKRFNESNKKIKMSVDIMKKIKLNKVNDDTQKKLRWYISSIICHKGDSFENGYYYCINKKMDKWILFDYHHIPSLTEIDISDDDVKEIIMTECVLLIYSIG